MIFNNLQKDIEVENSPMVSVVMSVYNESREQLERSIASITEQTYRNIEFLILLDNPANIIAKKVIEKSAHNDSRISIVESKEHMGVADALNMLIQSAHGVYVARQDADDYSYPERLLEQVLYLERNRDVDVLGTGIRYVDESSGKVLLERTYSEDISNTITIESPLAHPTVLVRKGVYEKHGYYDASKKYVEDYDLWIRWHLRHVVMKNLHKIFYDHYQSAYNTKNSKTKKQLFATVRLKWAYRKELELSLFDYSMLGFELVLMCIPSRYIRTIFYRLKNSTYNDLLCKSK